MRIFVIGANGQIGKILIEKLTHTNHTPIAMVRQQEQLMQLEKNGIEGVLADLEGSIEAIQAAIIRSKADAVVFTAGSGGHTGADKTMLIDLDGAVKSMKAAENAGVSRFVIVSAIGAHNWHTATDRGSVSSYYVAAKYYADLWLEHSDLAYTIIRPGGLTNDLGTGKIKVADTLAYATITREDVAEVIIAALENEETIGKSFDVVNGDVSIVDELNQL